MNTLINLGLERIINLVKSSPTLAINYALQSVFFGLAISSFIVLTLKFIRFSYAKTVVDNTIARMLFVGLFLYLKVWNYWSTWFIMIGYACGIFMCLYTFDCTLNIA